MLASLSAAQVVGPGFVQYVTSAPSGACSQGSPQQNVMGSGTIYTCQNGTWAQASGGASGSVLLAPSANQTIISSANQLDFFNVPYTNFSSIAKGFLTEQNAFGEFPLLQFGTNNNPSTMWVFNDRDGSDPVQATAYLTSFITNAVDRPVSYQSTALSLQSRGRGAGAYGFLVPVAINSQWQGPGALHQITDLFVAIPQVTGGTIGASVGIDIEDHSSARTGAPGVSLYIANGGTGLHDYGLYVARGNNYLGIDRTYMNQISLSCPATEASCPNAFSTLLTAANGTIEYCSDCDTPASEGATCSSSGDKVGAEAHRIRGTWKCF